MVVGKRLMRTQVSDITVCISGVAIPFPCVNKIIYLGVSISASSTLDVDVSFMQRRFYSSYNSILRLLFGLQDTNSVISNYQRHYGYIVDTQWSFLKI